METTVCLYDFNLESNSSTLCCYYKIVSAVVTHPLHAKQSLNVTFAVYLAVFLIKSGF